MNSVQPLVLTLYPLLNVFVSKRAAIISAVIFTSGARFNCVGYA